MKTKPQWKVEVHVTAPIAKVWEAIDDLSLIPQYHPDVRHVECLSGQTKRAPGVTYKCVVPEGRKGWCVEQVVEHVPNRRMSVAKSGAASLAGVDLAPKMLDVARDKLATQHVRADLRVADAEDSLPWASESFDIATLTATLHHFYRPHDALKEVRRVLRPGGRVLVIDPCFFTPIRQIVNLYLRVGSHDGDCRFYSPRRARRLLADEGFLCRAPKRVGLWAFLVIGVNARSPHIGFPADFR